MDKRKKLLFCLSLLIIFIWSGTALAQWSSDPDSNTAICTAPGNQGWYAKLVTDGAKGAIIAWRDQRAGTTNYDIYAQCVDSLGYVQWNTNGVAVAALDGYQYNHSSLVSDGCGGAYIAWGDGRVGAWGKDVYAQRVNSNGSFAWTENGIPISSATGDQDYPELAPDASGGVIIAWSDTRAGNKDIYAQRVSASGDTLWAANGVPVIVWEGDQNKPQVVPDGHGGAIIAWEDKRAGISDYDIYAQRIDSSGAIQWDPAGVPIAVAPDYQYRFDIIPDGSNGAILCWWDRRTGSYDIYAQRVSGDGVCQWDSNGVAVCVTSGDQNYCKLASDGSEGAIITWQGSGIYAQRVSAGGVCLWDSNGVLISSSGANPALIADDSGGAIITWQGSCHAQRVNSDGILQWTWAPNGALVSTPPVAYPAIIQAGPETAIITWQSNRVGNDDVYAQLLYNWGAISYIGSLAGTVTELSTSAPIENAMITIGSNTGYSNESGEYLIEGVPIGVNYTVTCDASDQGYNIAYEYGVEIVQDETTYVNFELTSPTSPTMTIYPTSIDTSIAPNDSIGFTTYITVSNDGNGPLNWQAYLTFQAKYRNAWDLLFNYDVNTSTGSDHFGGCEFDGTYFYVTEYGYSSNKAVFKLDTNGNLVSSFDPTWLSENGLKDLAWDGEYLYGSPGGSDDPIYCFDTEGNLITTFTAPVRVRGIAYDEDNDAFWCSYWDTDIYLVGRDGSTLDSIPNPAELNNMFGLAYDNVSSGGPYLWIFDRAGGTSSYPQKIYQMEIATGTLTGVSHNVVDELGAGVACGLFTTTEYKPGYLTIGGLIDGTSELLFGYELCQSATWISVEPTSGTVEPNGDSLVAVIFNSIGFSDTTLSADISFNSEPDVGTETVVVTLTVGEQQIVGDFNSDGYVDAYDLNLFGDHWHLTELDPGWDPLYNLDDTPDGNGNQIIDAYDLNVFGDHWHEGTPPKVW